MKPRLTNLPFLRELPWKGDSWIPRLAKRIWIKKTCQSLQLLAPKLKMRVCKTVISMSLCSFILQPVLLTQVCAQNYAYSIFVDTLSDDPDENLADRKCDIGNGRCSFRAAIETYNSLIPDPGFPDDVILITFRIPGSQSSQAIRVIHVGSSGLGRLPPVTGLLNLVIEGTELIPGPPPPVYKRVELDGSRAGPDAIGLQLVGPAKYEVTGFVIDSFSSHGIKVSGNGGHRLASLIIGLDFGGTLDKGNGGDGIFIDNSPGNKIEFNTIAGNNGYAIHIAGEEASGNRIEKNKIGLDVLEQNVVPNEEGGIYNEDAPNTIIGGVDSTYANIIAGKKTGVKITGSLSEGAKVEYNHIGKDGTQVKLLAGIFTRAGKLGPAKQLTVRGNVLTNIDSVGLDIYIEGEGDYNIRENEVHGEVKVGTKIDFATHCNLDVFFEKNFLYKNKSGLEVNESLMSNINWIINDNLDSLCENGGQIIFRAGGKKNFERNRWVASAGIAFLCHIKLDENVSSTISVSDDVFIDNNIGYEFRNELKATAELDVNLFRLTSSQNRILGGSIVALDVHAGALCTYNDEGSTFSYNAGTALQIKTESGTIIDALGLELERGSYYENEGDALVFFGIKRAFSVKDNSFRQNKGAAIKLEQGSFMNISGNTITGNGTGILIRDSSSADINHNIITANGKAVLFEGIGLGTVMTNNSIFANADLAIDLNNDGVTHNDPGDVDSGPNNLQNFPLLTFIDTTGGEIAIRGTLNSIPNTRFRLEFFSNSTCDPSGFGEGKTFLGFDSVTTDAIGNSNIFVTLENVTIPGNEFTITATATDPNNNTSEFGPCQLVMSESVPIKIKSFTAYTQSDKSVMLKWESVIEIDSYQYVVQKSVDGRTFSEIGNLKAAGNSAQAKMYTFNDRQLFKGAAYYRLKLVDMDGSFEYSKIIYVNNGQVKLGALSVFPNPFRSEVQIKGVAASDVIHNNIRIFDALGRKIPFSIRGANAISIDPALPKGIYLLKFKEETIKLFKE